MQLTYAIIGSVIGFILLMVSFSVAPEDTPTPVFAVIPMVAILVAWYLATQKRPKRSSLLGPHTAETCL